jgi:protein-S-isoprenylcysteine O-methyltransferase Ste14
MLAFTALWMATLFGGAGRLDWIRGWIYVAIYLGSMAALGMIVRRMNPDVIEARAKWLRKDTKAFDKVFLPVFLLLTFIQLVVAGLDAVRFHWSSMPSGLLFPGVLLLLAGIALMGWVMTVNPHAETTVRIQTERGHRVITSGPYRFVRHPMYTGAILLYVATPLVLCSLWALVVGAAIVLAFFWRTILEDRTLRAELPGYEEYVARTRYRLIPGIW